MVGISGVMLMDGAVVPLLRAGVSLTEMLGIGGAVPLDPRFGAGDSLTDIEGISGVTETEGVVEPRLGAGDSLTDTLGIGGVAPVGGA
jgi:hypothetical protein